MKIDLSIPILIGGNSVRKTIILKRLKAAYASTLNRVATAILYISVYSFIHKASKYFPYETPNDPKLCLYEEWFWDMQSISNPHHRLKFSVYRIIDAILIEVHSWRNLREILNDEDCCLKRKNCVFEDSRN